MRTPPLRHLLLAAVLTLAVVAEALAAGEGWRTATVSAIAAASLAWVRQMPLAVAAVVLACYAAVPGATQTVLTVIPYLVSLAAVGRYATLPAAGGIAVGAALVLGLTDIDAVKSASHLAGNLVYYGLFSAVLVGGGQLLSYGERRERQLANLARNLDEGSAEREREAIEAERHRMARELHDVIAQTLTIVSVHATVARTTFDSDRARASASLQRIETAAEQAAVDMRRLLGLLREQPDGSLPHLGRLAELVDDARAAGLDVTVDVDLGEQLPRALDLTVYRIMQECLSNCRRHAPGARVSILVTREGQSICATVESTVGDARAPAGPVGSGLGLIGMRERVALHGGHFEAGPTASGYRVTATFPDA